MAILGSVAITGFVAPTSELDIYPSHKALYGHGGYRTVQTIIDRDAITEQRREEGMVVYVVETDTSYILKGGIENIHWTINSGSGGSDASIVIITTTSSIESVGQAILVDASSEDIVLTLPEPVTCFNSGRSAKIGITRIDNTSHSVTINTLAGLIMLEDSMELYSLEVVNFITDGSNWWLGA